MLQNSASRAVGTDLSNGNVLHQLYKFAFPLLLANIVQQLYNSVDVAVIGHYVGSIGTVGVSTGGEIPAMFTFVATSFGSAGQIYVSQLYGAKEHSAINEAIRTLMSFMLLTAAVLAVVCILFCDTFLGWLNCPAEAMVQAHSYMVITSFGLPFIFGYNALAGIMRGMGESRSPLLFITAAAISNILIDLLLVVVIPLEAVGTAIATVAAQVACFAAAYIYLYRRGGQFQISVSPAHLKTNGTHLIVLLKLGLPLTFQSAFIHLSQLVCASQINLFGLTAAATNNIGMKIQRFITTFISSMTTGAGAMVGQCLGAKKPDRVKRIVYTTMACAFCFSVTGILVCLLLPRQAFSLFTTDSAVIEFGVTYLRVTVLELLLAPIHGSYQSVITGCGNVRLNFLMGILDGVVLRLGISFFLAYWAGLGVLGFFLGNALARLAPVAISMTYFYCGKWKTHQLLFRKNKE